MSNIDKQQIRDDIARRKLMPYFGIGPDHSLARLKTIQETQRSFGLEVVEALLDELELATDACNGWQKKYSEADERLEAAEKRLNEILTPNMLLPVIDEMDADNLRYVIKTVSENYSLLHAKWEAAEKRIAEFEALARGVKQFSEFQICHYGATEDYAKGYIDCQNNYNKVLFAAAVKGE